MRPRLQVLPFALGFFVLVEGLSVNGWIDLFADGIGRASAQSLPAAIFLVGWLAVVLSNAINNQPSESHVCQCSIVHAICHHLMLACWHGALHVPCRPS